MSSLVVPIRVEALPVGAHDNERVVAPYADFAAVAGRYAPYVGAQVVSRLFTGGRPLERGVHVHWHLPRALLRAAFTSDGELTPPPAPDRWLVVCGKRRRLIESNVLYDEPLHSQTTFPLLEETRQFAYIGRVHDFEAWPAARGERHADLHAFGYGIPDFAGCYSNCRNVFGFCDDEAPEGQELSYVVVGWHEDATRDPLAGGRDPAELGWCGPRGPRRTFYVGAVRGVRFGADGADGAPPAPLKSQVALGNTPQEALAALAFSGDPRVERLFTAFQLGALRRLGAISRVEERIHAAGFAAADAGVVYEVQAGQGATLPEDLAPELSELNRRQDAYDRERAELITLRRRLYADFYRRAQLRAQRWRPEIDFDALDDLIESGMREIDTRAARLTGEDEAIRALVARLGQRLPDARLVPVPAPRFYRPNDPVVVLAGKGVASPPPDAKDALGCEVTDLDAAGLAALAAGGGPGVPEPEIALREWKAPWRPVEVAWRVALQSPDALASLDPDVVLESFELHPGLLDFELRDEAVAALPDEYEGRVPLGANASAALERQLAGLVEPDVLTLLQETPLVVQALGGFTQSLGMLDQALQLPVADPFGTPLERPFIERIARAVDDQGRLAPLPDNPFSPLRSGRFTLSALRLVDEFGRWREVDVSELAVSETIPVRGGALVPPLRLTQPSRLRFRWRIAGRPETDASRLPGASPICGWLVPSHLDGALVFYDEDGTAVGRLAPAGERTLWLDPPGADDDADLDAAVRQANPVLAAVARSLAGAADHLSAFVATIEAARTSIAPRLTGADQEFAALLGEPLALAQVELDLSLLGLPLLDMSHRAFLEDVARGDVLQRTDGGAPGVRFPVLLGNRRQVDDGLVGFFTGAGDTIDYGRFYAATPRGGHAAIVEPPVDAITVSPNAPPVVVTLLIDPRCPVHAATGILPVKALTIPGDLAARGLAALEYTFLTGPLIVPPGSIAAPVPAGPRAWSWVDRGGDGFAWRSSELAPQDPDQLAGRRRIVDGWLKLG